MPEQTFAKSYFPILSLFVALFVGVNLAILGIYRLGWDTPFSRTLGTALGLPAAVVNGRFVSFSDLYGRTAITERLQQLAGQDFAVSDDEVLRQLIADELVRELAFENRLVVSPTKLALFEDYVLVSRGVKTPADEELRQVGLTAAEFRETFVLADYLRALVAIHYLQNASASRFSEARGVWEQVQTGQLTFAEAAARYSDDDSSKYLSGDTGFRSQSELPPWLSAAAFALELNEVSGVVVSPDGFRLLQVTAYDEESDPPRLQVREIFFADDSFEKFFADYVSRQSVYVFKSF